MLLLLLLLRFVFINKHRIYIENPENQFLWSIKIDSFFRSKTKRNFACDFDDFFFDILLNSTKQLNCFVLLLFR